jgi:hypothetical protein
MEEFDYKKFLVENKLTINSRLLNEEPIQTLRIFPMNTKRNLKYIPNKSAMNGVR